LALHDLIRQLEVHTDINLTFNRVSFLADFGIGPTEQLMIIERMPFSRGVTFYSEEREAVFQSLSGGDLMFSQKAKAAQHHYSTALALLAGEDQVAGLLDAAFMQFYLAIECILETHKSDRAGTNGALFFGTDFSPDLAKIVRHVYVARHRFFGHGQPEDQKAQADSSAAFAIAKQTLVARWCARRLISLELKAKLVAREIRLYPGTRGSIGFNGEASQLDGEFALP
jgi:hypothetical protein